VVAHIRIFSCSVTLLQSLTKYYFFAPVSVVKIKTEPKGDTSDISDCEPDPQSGGDSENESDSDPPSSGIYHAHFYNGNQRLPTFRYGLTEGMQTKDVIRELLNISDDSQVATAVPCNVSHNSAFIVDSWSLDDACNIKSDDMALWTNQG
jgi:hypothetical protein